MSALSTGGSRAIPPRRVLSDDVYDAVLALLLDGEIEPGARANIESIARQLDVSPTPVREALARLESDGLVVKRALKGYTAAAPLDAQGFDNLFDLRLQLEPHAAALAAARLTPSSLANLREWVDDMKSMTIAGPVRNERFEDYRAFAAEDANLHTLIAEASGNALLADSITRLRPHLHQYRLYFERGVAEVTNAEHDAIVSALERGDAKAAEKAMRTHLSDARTRIARYFQDASGTSAV